MSTAIQMKPVASLPALSMSETELMGVLRSSLYVGAKDESIKMAVNYCKAAGLDIMQKPVHLVPMYDSKAREMRDVVMPGIGLYRTQASRSGEMAGIDEPVFGDDVKQVFEAESYYDKYEKANKAREAVTVTYPKWCKVTVRKLMPNGMIAEYHAKELWLENYATASKDSAQPNSMWKKRPYAQLAKCAEAQALRKAFPELGSMPTAEEMEGKEIDITPQQDSQNANAAQKPAEKPTLPFCTDANFSKNESAWKEAVTSGKKTPAGLINQLQTRYLLTEPQKQTIEAWAKQLEVIEADFTEVPPADDFLNDYESTEQREVA